MLLIMALIASADEPSSKSQCHSNSNYCLRLVGRILLHHPDIFGFSECNNVIKF